MNNTELLEAAKKIHQTLLRTLTSTIESEITVFEAQTGLKVDSVYVRRRHAHMVGEEPGKLEYVEVEAKLTTNRSLR